MSNLNHELNRARGLSGRAVRATTSTPAIRAAYYRARAYGIPYAQAHREVLAERVEATLPLFAGPA